MSVNEKMTAIADAIRGKTGGTDALTLDQMAAAVRGIEAGGGGENVLDYCTTLYSAFNSVNFGNKDITVSFGAKIDSIKDNAIYASFIGASGLDTLTLICECPEPGSSIFQQTFRKCSVNTIDISKIGIGFSGLDRTFRESSVKTIIGEIDLSAASTVSSAFGSMTQLETVRFKENSIPLSIGFADSLNLTDETIQNIIDGLADLTGATAQTLTLHATVGAKLTDDQKAAASAKNWTISY